MKISSVGSNCNTTVKTSAKTVTNPSKKMIPITMKTPRHQKTASAGVSHNPQRSNSLGSYLAVTTGVGVASLLNADGAIIAYNGAAVTVTAGPWPNETVVYWEPVGMTVGKSSGFGSDRFQFMYNNTNYIYSSRNETAIKMYLGTFGIVPLKLAASATIDASTNWSGDTFTYMNRPGWTTANSPWATGVDGTNGFIPFKFYATVDPGNQHYGWADFTYNDASGSLTLNNFAYNNTPNAGIMSGEGAIPEPSSMLLLAMGGTSVLVVRRRRKSQETEESIAS